MREKVKRHRTFSLDTETVKVIERKSIEKNGNYSRALDAIVREWIILKREEPLDLWELDLTSTTLELRLAELSDSHILLGYALSRLWLDVRDTNIAIEEEEAN